MTRFDLPGLLLLTLRQPRAALRALLALDLPGAAIWALLGLVAVGSAFVLHLGLVLGLMDLPQEAALQAIFGSPFGTAAVQLAVLCLAVALAHGVGRMFGGRGTVEEVALALGWLQAVLLALQIAQFLAYLVLPPLAGMIGLVSAVLFFWLLSQFLAEVHGFRNALAVFFGILGTTIALAILLSLVLAMVLPPGVLHV